MLKHTAATSKSWAGFIGEFAPKPLKYEAIDKISGFRLNEDQEFAGADLSIHHINAYSEENLK